MVTHRTMRVATIPMLLAGALLTTGAGAQSAAGAPPRAPTRAGAHAAATDDVAVSPSTATLSLAEALRIARAGAPAFRSASARRDLGIGRAAELAQWPNPTIEYRRENLGSPLAPDIFGTLYIPFDVSGRRSALRATAREMRSRADLALVAERRVAERHVVLAWIRAAAARQSLIAVTAHANGLREILRIETERVAAGTSAELARWRIDLETARARHAEIEAQLEQDAARAELAVALGVAPAALPVVDTLPPLPVEQALPPVPSVEETAAAAARFRPELRAAQFAVGEADARLRAEQRGTLGGDWQLQGGTKQTGGFTTAQLGVALPLPLFNRNGGSVQRARADLAAALADRDDVRNAALADAATSRQALLLWHERIAEPRLLSARGDSLAASMRVAWQEGQATLLELLDAERMQADARRLHIRWIADALRARYEYERAIGARLAPDSPLDLPLFAPVAGASIPPASP